MADGSDDVPRRLSIRNPPRILVPVDVLAGKAVTEPLARFLAPAEIIVLGYHLLPEQTPTEQASLQFEDRAQAAVEDVAQQFREAGRTVETRVAFTHDRDQTVDRVAAEVGATAVLLVNPSGPVEELVVPVRGAIDVDRLADLVGTLIDDHPGRVTLWGLGREDGEFDVEATLEHAHETLLQRGLPADRIRTERSATATPIRTIVERSEEFDLIVMGEETPTLLSTLLGEDSERVAEAAVAPVVIVRRGDSPGVEGAE